MSVNQPLDHPLLGFRQKGPVPFWLNHLDEQLLPWIADHAVEGMPVLPAAAILEMALASARWLSPAAPVLEVVDLEVRRPLPFDKGRMREIRTVIASEDGDWELASRPRLSSDASTVHAVGRLSSTTDARALTAWADRGRAEREIDRESLYRFAHLTGLDYGSRFRTVCRIEIFGSDQAVAHLDASPIERDPDSYLLHPALLDGALQALLGLIADSQKNLRGVSFLPWRFGRVRFLAPFGRIARYARLRVTRIGVRSASADIAVFDDAGSLVAELSDCWFRRLELTHRGSLDQRSLRVDLVPAPLAELPAAAALEAFGGGPAAACCHPGA